MPPFWVTSREPSAASAAPLAPPPVSATRDTSPRETSTRRSAPSATLVTTRILSPHQTGPSPNRTPSHTTSLRMVVLLAFHLRPDCKVHRRWLRRERPP